MADRKKRINESNRKTRKDYYRGKNRSNHHEVREIMVFGRRPVQEINTDVWAVKDLLIASDSNLTPESFPNIANCHVFRKTTRKQLDQLTNGASHQGVAAYIEKTDHFDIKDILDQSPDIIVAVDRVQDTRNLGAIIRTAEASGCGGLIYSKRRGAPITSATIKASAGAAMHLPLCGVSSLATALRRLRQHGYHIVGCDASGDSEYDSATFRFPVCLVMGAEGQGLSRLVAECCETVVSIRMYGKVSSLNVSVAAGIVLFKIRSLLDRTPK